MSDGIYDGAPEGLPPIQEPASTEQRVMGDPLAHARTCPTCKGPTRIQANYLGIQAYCGPCKLDWPVGPPVKAIIPPIGERGISKQTVVAPDWGMAFEPDNNSFK